MPHGCVLLWKWPATRASAVTNHPPSLACLQVWHHIVVLVIKKVQQASGRSPASHEILNPAWQVVRRRLNSTGATEECARTRKQNSCSSRADDDRSIRRGLDSRVAGTTGLS